MGGGATSQADGQAIDGTGTSDSYEVTGLPGWLPHRTSRQVRRKDTAPGRIGSGNRRVRPVLVGSRNHQWQQGERAQPGRGARSTTAVMGDALLLLLL